MDDFVLLNYKISCASLMSVTSSSVTVENLHTGDRQQHAALVLLLLLCLLADHNPTLEVTSTYCIAVFAQSNLGLYYLLYLLAIISLSTDR